MSVLIKGIEMPKKDSVMLWILPNGIACVMDDSDRQYKVIELPPHGRLVDADELDKQMVSEIASGITILYDNLVEWISSYIDNAPTVIEAEGRKE